MGKGRWAETAISWDFGPGGVQWGAPGKSPRRSPVESGRGVSGGKAQAPISPGEGFDCFPSERIAILASSGMQEAASSDFQQIGQ